MDKILKNQENIKYLVVSDAHIGSNSGILPPNADEFDGETHTPLPQNNLQQMLWNDYIFDAKKTGKVDVLINCGDNVEGKQMKIAGMTLRTSDIDTQKNLAVDTLQYLFDICKPKYFIGCTGTHYHIGMSASGNADFGIYDILRLRNPNVKFIFKDVVELQIGDLAWQIAHVTPTTENILNAHEKNTKQHALAMYQDKSDKINVFCRGHCHHFSWSLNYGAYNFTAPCQQPTSSFSRSKPRLIMDKPDVGLLMLQQCNDTLIPQPMLHNYKNKIK